jgi:hypothetical protein
MTMAQQQNLEKRYPQLKKEIKLLKHDLCRKEKVLAVAKVLMIAPE